MDQIEYRSGGFSRSRSPPAAPQVRATRKRQLEKTLYIEVERAVVRRETQEQGRPLARATEARTAASSPQPPRPPRTEHLLQRFQKLLEFRQELRSQELPEFRQELQQGPAKEILQKGLFNMPMSSGSQQSLTESVSVPEDLPTLSGAPKTAGDFHLV